MKNRTKYLFLVFALAMCLSLTACGASDDNSDGPDVGGDWRVTGVVRDSGTITRDGEDTVVLVCIHEADASFYYDTEDQTLFDFVEYPITLAGDPWEMFQGIDFADLNGDGQGDLVPDDGDAVPVLMSDALPFANIETLQSENHEDGTYYYADMAEDGLILVVNTVLPRNLVDDAQTLEDYLTGCALDLGGQKPTFCRLLRKMMRMPGR